VGPSWQSAEYKLEVAVRLWRRRAGVVLAVVIMLADVAVNLSVGLGEYARSGRFTFWGLYTQVPVAQPAPTGEVYRRPGVQPRSGQSPTAQAEALVSSAPTKDEATGRLDREHRAGLHLNAGLRR
jgi:hypothetical protein